MTDGPTGFHVAPITEDDMNRVTSILKRATDAIIGISQLSADVDMLRQTVSSLQTDTERLRSQNNALDEALNYSRGERDRQATLLAQKQDELNKYAAELAETQAKADKLELTNGQYEIDLDLTRKAKDDAEFHNLELEDKLKAAEAKLTKVAELHRALFTPEPVSDPVTVGEDVSLGYPKDDGTPKEHAPVEQGPDTRETWEPGYFWDHDTGKYWRQGLTPKPDGADIPY